MKDRLTLAVDAMGGDKAPGEIIKGACLALDTPGFELVIFGPEDIVKTELEKHSYDKNRIRIVNTTQIIEMDESPTKAIKSKKDSSMVKGMQTVKAGEADAFVSAGNSGALLTGATLIIGRIKGISRPALGTSIPGRKGYTFLIDSGANVDCKPEYLAQFAKMGSIYVEKVQKIPNPRVALINVGAEKEKGNALTKEAYELLEKAEGINFIGNIEARDIPKGGCDVAVCDAFVGNVVLKLTEGLASSLMGMVKDELMSSTISKIGAALARGSFENLKKRFDYAEVGGAPFLGLKKIVIKAHGSSDHRAIKNAIMQAYKFAALDLSSEIEKYCSANESDGELSEE